MMVHHRVCLFSKTPFFWRTAGICAAFERLLRIPVWPVEKVPETMPVHNVDSAIVFRQSLGSLSTIGLLKSN